MMYRNRALRLLTANVLCKLVSKSNYPQCNYSINFIRLYNKQVTNNNASGRLFEQFLSRIVFQNKTNSRQIYVVNQSSYHSNYLKLMTFSGLLSFLFQKKEEESELITTIKRGILSMQREDYKTAEQILHLALRLAQEQHNEDGVTYIYDLLANVALESKEWKKSEELFLEVMKRELSRGTPQDDMKIIHMSLKLAKIYESVNDYEKAEHGFQFCLKHLQERVDKSTEDEDVLILWAMALDWYARFLQVRGKMNEAIEYYRKAYDMCVRLHGEVHEQNVVLLNDIGTIMFLKGDKESALEYMNKAIEIGKHLPNMEDLASVYINLGNIYLQKGMYAEAEKSCTKGLQNATRHNNSEGLEEANECLKELKKVYRK